MAAQPERPAQQKLPANVKALGWASLLNDTASEMVYPLLPAFLIGVLGGNRLHLGIIEGAADSASSVLKLYSGGWSDRVGRRRGFVFFGYLLTVLSRPIIAALTAPWQLFAARTADRTGKGIRTAPRDALIADSTPDTMRGRAYGFHRAMDHLGAAIGPLLATLFLWFWPGQLRTLFLLTLVPGLAVLVLLYFGLRESPPAAAARTDRLRLTLRPFDRNFKLFLVALVVFTLGNSSDMFLLVRAQELGVAVAFLPLLWCAYHLLKSSGNVLAGRWVDRLGPKPLLLAGWLTYAAVYLAFAVATEAWEAWAFFLAYAVYYALTEPAEKTLAARLAGSERRGLAFGWFHLAVGLGTLPASVLFGLLYEEYGALVAFGWGAGLALLAAVLLLGVRSGPPTNTP